MAFGEAGALLVLFVNSETVGEVRTAWPKIFETVEKGTLQISKNICRSLALPLFPIALKGVRYECDSQ